MQWIVAKLLGSVTGPIFGTILDGYKAKLAAGTDHDRLAADLAARELAVDQREAELRTNLLIAEQGHIETRVIRPLFAAPFIVYNLKLVVWDKVLGWGATDALSSDLTKVEMIVISGYFAVRTAQALMAGFGRR